MLDFIIYRILYMVFLGAIIQLHSAKPIIIYFLRSVSTSVQYVDYNLIPI